MDDHKIMISVILAVNAVACLVLAFCLAHTWKFWRQVKWYIILLLVGNVLQVLCTQGLSLGLLMSHWKRTDTTASCRFYTFMYTLGPSLSAMATAALALHVLLTSITGCQGNRLRHALVLGLFVLLSLPLPLAKLSIIEVKTYNAGWKEMTFCRHALEGPEEILQLGIGETLATVFFPAFLVICCTVTAAVVITRPAGTVKTDEDKSDVVLSGILGAILVVFCFPFAICSLVLVANNTRFSESHNRSLAFATGILRVVMDCFPLGTSVATVIFAYVHAYRNRGNPAYTNLERQKLVN